MHKSTRRFASLAGVLALFFTGATASADPLSTIFPDGYVSGMGSVGSSVGGNVTAKSTGSSVTGIKFHNNSYSSASVGGGLFASTFTASGSTAQQMQTYCVDLGETAKTTSTAAELGISSASLDKDQRGNDRNIGAAAWVVNNYQGLTLAAFNSKLGLVLTNNQMHLAIQLAVWKAAYDGENEATRANVTTAEDGNRLWFTGAASTVVSAVENILQNRSDQTSSALYMRFTPNSNQDQIAAVPEPSTFLIAGFGALAFAGYRFRRR